MNNKKIKEQDDTLTKRHISSSDISAFMQDQLKFSDLEIFLEHISSCDYCSDMLASVVENELIQAPIDMKENILKKSKRLDIQFTKARNESAKMQLFKYSLKVITASLCAIFLMLSVSKTPYYSNMNDVVPVEIRVENPDQPTLTASIRNGMDNFSNQILDFSNNLINMEVNKND
ncbi:MAG: hypothetical protein GX995_11590 [Clostridiales bacterium]|nr:hypothetical protein [Clostridiales bacterium]